MRPPDIADDSTRSSHRVKEVFRKSSKLAARGECGKCEEQRKHKT